MKIFFDSYYDNPIDEGLLSLFVGSYSSRVLYLNFRGQTKESLMELNARNPWQNEAPDLQSEKLDSRSIYTPDKPGPFFDKITVSSLFFRLINSSATTYP